jgi:hypothetical protein
MVTKRKAEPSSTESKAKQSTGRAVFSYENGDKLEWELIDGRAEGKERRLLQMEACV